MLDIKPRISVSDLNTGAVLFSSYCLCAVENAGDFTCNFGDESLHHNLVKRTAYKLDLSNGNALLKSFIVYFRNYDFRLRESKVRTNKLEFEVLNVIN